MNIIKDEYTQKLYELDSDGKYYKKRKFNGFFAGLFSIFYFVGLIYMGVAILLDTSNKNKNKLDWAMTPLFFALALGAGGIFEYFLIKSSNKFMMFRPTDLLLIPLVVILILAISKFRIYFYEKAAYGKQNGRYRQNKVFYSMLPYINGEGFLEPVSLKHALIASVITSATAVIMLILTILGFGKNETLIGYVDGRVYSMQGTKVQRTDTGTDVNLNTLI